MKKISDKELNKLINECKTSGELRKLQMACCNEMFGSITDKQAMRILKIQQKLEKLEQKNYKNNDEGLVSLSFAVGRQNIRVYSGFYTREAGCV